MKRTERKRDGRDLLALLIAGTATLIRDAQTTTSGRTLGEVKPITRQQRVKAAADAVKEICQ